MTKSLPPVVTRFAPSPSGFLHIGGARTALFNWLFTRHHGGQFRLRIEDTDRARSSDEAIAAIIDGLTWLGLDWDDEVFYQSSQQARHAEVAADLLAAGKAYKCFATPEQLKDMREAQKAAGQPIRYDGRWRDRDPDEAPQGAPFVVRLRAPQNGQTVIDDKVQGKVVVKNDQLDDMVLLRSDGTPTYMLSVVVDDHDMGITHIIRGDDHLSNAFRQRALYDALGWAAPSFAHIPLIHGADGAKLSKRHGALGVEAYREMGYLPAALRNYLLRLGWGHGDAEIISADEAVKLFSLEGVGKGPARFDFKKLDALNAHYMRHGDPAATVSAAAPFFETKLGRPLDGDQRALLETALPLLSERAKTLRDLVSGGGFLFAERPIEPDEKAQEVLTDEARKILARLVPQLEALERWDAETLGQAIGAFAETEGLKLGSIGPAVRGALTGGTASPGIFEVLALLGRTESLARLRDQAI
ncbi:MAG: glutamate--tRNA ligase [Proteobacteria bacterium]|nr:glutamate--tRNA ligase [Pseudomonadota bacterium]